MPDTNQLILFARYNQLMNQRQYAAAAKLSKDELHEDKGAFFKSVIGTLNHILIGDIIWLKRFAAHPTCSSALSYIHGLNTPKSLDELMYEDLDALGDVRWKIDELIVQWIDQLSENDAGECVSYTNIAGKVFSKPLMSLIYHLFLHQTHHRGQVTTLLSQCGIDFGETDLVEIIDDCGAKQGNSGATFP